MNPLVSIIVPNYNGAKYLDACINCLVAQTYKNIEVIIVDDGSTDNTPALCDEYAEKYDFIKVIHKANGGLSAARNSGFDASAGEYVYFYDVDDTISPTLIEDNVRLAIDNDADIVMFCFWYYDEANDVLKDNDMKDIFIGGQDEFFHKKLCEIIKNEVFNAPWNKFIKKSLMTDNNIRFNTDYPIYEDINFAADILPAARKIVINNKMYYKYFVRSSGTLITRFFPNLFDSVSNYYKNILNYCNRFDNNEEQIKNLSILYVRLILNHIKQIALKNDLSKAYKKALIKRFCDHEQFIYAINCCESEYSGKKSYMLRLIKNKHISSIIMLYKILGKLESK